VKRLPKEHSKSFDDSIDRVDERIEQHVRILGKRGFIQDYLHNRFAVCVYLAGYVMRDGLKCQTGNLCLSYERDEKRLTSDSRPKIRRRKGRYSRPYEMKTSVLIDDMESTEASKCKSGVNVSVIPSVVRLQELDSPPLPTAESAYFPPFAAVFAMLCKSKVSEDREARTVSNLFGNTPSKAPIMQRVNDVIERTAKIEERITEDRCAHRGIDSWPLVSVERVLVALSLTLHPDGVSTELVEPWVIAGEKATYFVPQLLTMVPCPKQLLPSVQQLPRHHTTPSQ
jgi:hypothetical protein